MAVTSMGSVRSSGDCPDGGLRYTGYAAAEPPAVLLLKSHAYLAAYDNMSQSQQTDIVRPSKRLIR